MLIGLETPSQDDTLVVGLQSSAKYHCDKINSRTVYLPELDGNSTDKYYPAGCIIVGIWLKCDNEFTSDNNLKELEQVITRFYGDHVVSDVICRRDISELHHCIFSKERIVVVAIVTDSPHSHHSVYYHRNHADGVLTKQNSVSRMLSKTTVYVRLKAVFRLHQTMGNEPLGKGNDVTYCIYLCVFAFLDYSQVDSYRNVINKSALWIPHIQSLLMSEGSTAALDSFGLTSSDVRVYSVLIYWMLSC